MQLMNFEWLIIYGFAWLHDHVRVDSGGKGAVYGSSMVVGRLWVMWPWVQLWERTMTTMEETMIVAMDEQWRWW